MPRTATLVTALVAAAFAAGCGDDEKDSGPASATTASTGVHEEIDAVRRLLDQAVAAYEKGDAKTAERLVGDAYLEHFEEVEHPLEERDHELMERIEKAIATTARERIKAGAPAPEVKKLVDGIAADLDRAEALLK